MPEDSVHDMPLAMNAYSDDESTLVSEGVGDLDDIEYRLDLDLDLDDASSCSSSSDFGFVLDIGLLERSRNQSRSRYVTSSLEEDADALETDSLKLIRKRVPTQVDKDRLPVVTPAPQSFSVKKLDSNSYVEVCEVPLGVSLKDILPSTLCYRSRQKPNFSQLVRDNNRSESLLEDIDKALEILSAEAM
jgi:hypothetical protein